MLSEAVILSMSLGVWDSKGNHPIKAMPKDEAVAILATCNATKMPVHCAAVLTVLSFRESNNSQAASHDGGKGCGAFGVLCTYPHATWAEQVQSAWKLVLESTQLCEVALAKYASGSCNQGRALAREYMAMARKLAAPYETTGRADTK